MTLGIVLDGLLSLRLTAGPRLCQQGREVFQVSTARLTAQWFLRPTHFHATNEHLNVEKETLWNTALHINQGAKDRAPACLARDGAPGGNKIKSE
jgi:hypothetical protein